MSLNNPLQGGVEEGGQAAGAPKAKGSDVCYTAGLGVLEAKWSISVFILGATGSR